VRASLRAEGGRRKTGDDVRAVHSDGREGQPHGLENVVHLGFVADRLRIFGGDIRGAGDDLALNRIEMQMRLSRLTK